jgi:hypothetical protein
MTFKQIMVENITESETPSPEFRGCCTYYLKLYDSRIVLMAQGHPVGEDRLGIRMNDSHENVHETAKTTQSGVQSAMEKTEAAGTTIVT